MAVETRVAVVTGGGRGIGRGITLALAELGFALVVNYRSDDEAAESACREAETRGSPRAISCRADVAEIGQGHALLEETLHNFGSFDDDGFGVVQEPVQHGAGQGAVVVEDFGPVFVGLVGGQDDGAALVALADDLEEQVGAGLSMGR